MCSHTHTHTHGTLSFIIYKRIRLMRSSECVCVLYDNVEHKRHLYIYIYVETASKMADAILLHDDDDYNYTQYNI